jgi:hypothetical protein
MATAMSEFAHITFRTQPGTNNAKDYAVDDFTFRPIPAPGPLAALGLMTLAAAARRRR